MRLAITRMSGGGLKECPLPLNLAFRKSFMRVKAVRAVSIRLAHAAKHDPVAIRKPNAPREKMVPYGRPAKIIQESQILALFQNIPYRGNRIYLCP